MLFGPTPPKRITKEEFDKVMTRLYGKLDQKERDEVKKLFRADLHESGIEAGISAVEFENAMNWLAEHPEKHVLEESDIALIKEYCAEHLRD